jgi:hypothetical protein
MIATQTASGKWYLEHPERRDRAWTGDGFRTHRNGISTGPYKILLFSSKRDAVLYRLGVWHTLDRKLQEAINKRMIEILEAKKAPQMPVEASGGSL